MKRKTPHNSRFAKAGVSCFCDSELLNSSFVHPMKFSAENPRLRKAAKRYRQPYDDIAHIKLIERNEQEAIIEKLNSILTA